MSREEIKQEEIDQLLFGDMVNNDLFNFEFDKKEKCCSVTGYYGKSEEVIFPASHEGKPVKKIGRYFSSNNKRIKSVIIPEGYTSIGTSAFQDCTGLTEIKLSKNLTSIGKSAFEGCRGLTKIKLPKGLTSIGESAFDDCIGLKDIIFSKKLTSIGESAFSGCTSLTEIKLPESLTSIGRSAFWGCEGLTEIKFPESLTSIRGSAFIGCEGLIEIKLPENLTSIGKDVFLYCKNLTEISVDKNNPAFYAVDGILFDKAMTTLLLFPVGKKGKYSVPDGIISIDSDAFYGCKEITSIYLPQSFLYIDSVEGLKFYCKQLTEITVSGQNPNFCSVDGVLFDKEMSTLIAYPANKGRTNYTVPDGVKRISHNAFYGCKRLENIILPESLEFIGDSVFSECKKLKSVIFPMNLQYIGENVFEDCRKLKTITLSRKTRFRYTAFEGFKGKFIYMD